MIWILAESEMGEALVLTVVGIGVVFAALALLMFLIGLLQKLVRDPLPAAAPPPKVPAKSTSAAHNMGGATSGADGGAGGDGGDGGAGGENPQLIVVLAAAAAAALGRSVESVRVLRYQSSSVQWSSSGRRSLTTSHRPTPQAPRTLRL